MDNPQEGIVLRPTLWYNEIMNNITSEYIAGLIDGEGYLALIPSRTTECKNSSFEPVIKIGMTGTEVIPIFEHLISRYGGNMETRSCKTTGNRIAITYNLKSKKKVLKLLEDIQPYLIVKYEQSIILKDFCELPSSHTRYNNFDKSVITLKEEMYRNLKLLKQPPATTN